MSREPGLRRSQDIRIEVNILALFNDTEANNCFSIYHMQQNKNDQKQRIFKRICISAPVIIVENKTVFTRFQ
jgi:hypothetical protein